MFRKCRIFTRLSLKQSKSISLTSGIKFQNASSTEESDRLYSADKKTHFGFRNDISEIEKKAKVIEVFDSVAESYDTMNDAMSLGIHRLWKDHFVKILDPPEDMSLLDVAGGTGDIAFRVVDKLSPFGHVTVCDINASMLEVGKNRSKKLGEKENQMDWIVGDAQNLDFEDSSFDAYTNAFGIRNVVDINKALREAFRVLKPGGRFLCLEFSHVENPVIEQLYSFYSFQCIPPMGKVLAGDWDSYQYLVESIRRFPPQQEFAKMISNAGFSCVTHENLSFGVAAIHSGFKI